MYDEGGLTEMTDGSMAYYVIEKGHYQNEDSWPSIVPSISVTVFGYYDKQMSCHLDENNEPCLDVSLEENSSEQYDVLVAKETSTYNDCSGIIYLHFHHACAAAQFFIKKSSKMVEKGYKVDVSEVVLHNIPKMGRYMLDDFRWNIPPVNDNTVTNFTINAYQNKNKVDYITLTTDPVLLGKDENDFLFLLPTEITPASGNFSDAGPGESYLEIKCRIYDTVNQEYKWGGADGPKAFESVYLPFGYDLSDYKGKIKSFLINFGTSIRDISGIRLNL